MSGHCLVGFLEMKAHIHIFKVIGEMQTKLISNQFRANRAFWCPVPTHDLLTNTPQQHTLIEDEVHHAFIIEMRDFREIEQIGVFSDF